MMLLRKVAVYLMFAVLIVAFALWGVGDYVRQQSTQPLAKVGDVEVTSQQFQQAYERTLAEISARARRRISQQEARTYGLPQQVLEAVINETALTAAAKKLGIGLSDEGLRNVIYRNEEFQDNGTFSRQKYNQFLEEQGYTAIGFEQRLRSELIRRQVRGAFEQSGIVPQILVDAINRHTNERRTLTYFTLTPEMIGSLPNPTEEDLQKHYEANKGQFISPEFRKVLFAAVTPGTVTNRVSLTDAELKAVYDAKASDYGEPERRKLEIIPFQTKAAAETAAQELASGKDFLEVAKAAGFKQSEIDAGTVTRNELAAKSIYSNAVLDAAFSTENGKVSAPVESSLSTVIVRVLAVFPAREKTFDEVKDQIKTTLSKARESEELAKLTKSFEEARTAGVAITDTAQKLNVPVLNIIIDARGNGADGKPVETGGVSASAIANAAFKSDIGVENEAIRLAGGGYIWFEVLDIVKSQQKPFDQVKAEVEAGWRTGQIRLKVADKARDLVSRSERGEDFAEIAKQTTAELKTSQPLKRRDTDQGLPAASINQAFAFSEGGAGSATIGDGTSRVVFQLTKITPPDPLTEKDHEALRNRLSQALAQDNLAQFVTGIKTELGESRNTRLVNAIATGSVDAEAP